MDILEIKSEIQRLPRSDQLLLIQEIAESLPQENTKPVDQIRNYRRSVLNNKRGECPHCGHKKYVKYGIDKGAQRYKCKSCSRNFTEYTGTWMAGLHKKDKISSYLKLMVEEKSLDKIKTELCINKKTAFDWRHKILSSLSSIDKGKFTGITESDETFFFQSEKGNPVEGRKPRKRGGTNKRKGVNRDLIAVIVTQDRGKEIDLTAATQGRIKKVDIENAIGSRLGEKAILCSDSSVIYKGFAIDRNIEHHPLRSDLKQYVKNGVYHIQHVNSTHNKLKKWIDQKFWGVATKYLQQYLDWYRVKEMLKDSREVVIEFSKRAAQDAGAYQRYKDIPVNYKMLLSSQS